MIAFLFNAASEILRLFSHAKFALDGATIVSSPHSLSSGRRNRCLLMTAEEEEPRAFFFVVVIQAVDAAVVALI